MSRSITRFLVPLVFIQLVFLVLQFVLGMWINLFAPTASVSPVKYNGYTMGYMMAVMLQTPEIIVHMMNGMLIGLIAIIILFVTLFTRKYELITLGTINGIMMLMAGMSGIFFLLSGMQNNNLSFVMAIGFIGVILSDLGLIYFTDKIDIQSVKPNSEAMKILKERYAKGEITKEQFDQMMVDLE